MRRKLEVKSILLFAALIAFIIALIFFMQSFEMKNGKIISKAGTDKMFSASPTTDLAPPSIILDLPNLLTQPTCESYYKRFLQDKVLSIGIFLGYKDSRPSRFVGDSIEAYILIQKLLRPCVVENKACGFQLASINPTKLIKNLRTGGLRFRTEVTIWHSSLTLDDDFNRKLPEQKIHSAEIETAFKKALMQNDMVFYNGHSRDGGGPDFFPPRLDSHNKTNYSWYTESAHGVKVMNESLGQSNQPLILGLFSCASDGHFKSELFKNKKDLTLITSAHLLYYADALKNLYGGIHGAMHLLCKEQFNLSIRFNIPKEGSSLQTAVTTKN